MPSLSPIGKRGGYLGSEGSSWPCSISGSASSRQSGWLVILTTVSLVFNFVIAFMLLTGEWNHGGSGTFAVPASASTANTDLVGLQTQLATWQTSHADIVSKFETLKTKYTELQAAHTELRNTPLQQAAGAADCTAETAKVTQLEANLAATQKDLAEARAAAGAAANAGSGTGVCPKCTTGVDQSRLLDTDLSLHPFDPTKHETVWSCTHQILNAEGKPMPFCSEEATNEQSFQLSFFDRPGAGSRAYAVKNPKPQSPKCVQLPPAGYKFPAKVQSMPLAEGEQAVHWPNLRVQKLEDLLVFNRGTPKNLYHFNASFYDYEQEGILNHAAKYIPWGHKVRTMLDVGSGGASLGMLAKRRYDVQVVSTVFADWPYCEYISERGQICMYIDAMEAMPFAKFSYDVVHSSWVFHALFNHQLRAAYLEQNRILRPGGYMWIYGGWSLEQVATMEQLLINELGYTPLLSQKNLVDRTKVKHSFDDIPFELEWTAILLKPIHADENSCHRVYEEKKL